MEREYILITRELEYGIIDIFPVGLVGRAIMEVFQQIQDIGDVFYKQRVTELDGSSDSTAFQQRGMKSKYFSKLSSRCSVMTIQHFCSELNFHFLTSMSALLDSWVSVGNIKYT